MISVEAQERTAMLEGVEVKVQRLESLEDLEALVEGDVIEIRLSEGEFFPVVFNKKMDGPKYFYSLIGVEGANWEDITVYDIFPELKYVTVKDGRIEDKRGPSQFLHYGYEGNINKIYRGLVQLAHKKWATEEVAA